MKKIMSVLLCAVLLLCTCIPILQCSAQAQYPVVYIVGQGDYLYNADGELVFPVNLPENYVQDAVAACMPSFIKAVTFPTQSNKNEYKEMFLQYFLPLYSELRMDENGDSQPGIYNSLFTDGKKLFERNDFPLLKTYGFHYDWRMDACENAVILNTYIETVKKTAGVEKVNVVGRCEGSCVLLAYLAAYGHDSLNSIMLLNPACNGFSGISCSFSGRFEINGAAIDRYCEENKDSLSSSFDPVVSEFLFSTVTLARTTYGLDIAGNGVELIFASVLREMMPEILLGSYGSMPGMWGMVNRDYYEDAISLVFGNEEYSTKYAGLLAKIQNYHDTVAVNMEQLLLDADKDGVRVGCISKYGFQGIPVLDDYDEQSDGQSLLKHSSFGASTTKIGTAYADSYIEKMTENGLGQYFSPDKQVYAGTCLFPETTWIIKNLRHTNFPWQMDYIAALFFRANGDFTVRSDPEYPQFTVYNTDSGALEVPSVEQDDDADTPTQMTGFFAALRQFWKALIAFLKQYFSK